MLHKASGTARILKDIQFALVWKKEGYKLKVVFRSKEKEGEK